MTETNLSHVADRPLTTTDAATQTTDEFQSTAASSIQTPQIPAVATNPPERFICSITGDVFHDPVIASDGHIYERKALDTWRERHSTSPQTRETLQPNVFPNRALRSEIQEWVSANPSWRAKNSKWVNEEALLNTARLNAIPSQPAAAAVAGENEPPPVDPLDNPPPNFICPITLRYMQDPVSAPDGHNYERRALMDLMAHNRNISPMTGEPMDPTAIQPNSSLKTEIDRWVVDNGATPEPTGSSAAAAEQRVTQTEAIRIPLPPQIMHALPAGTPTTMDVPSLTWSRVEPNTMTFEQAQSFAHESGMRIPTVPELIALRLTEDRLGIQSNDRWFWSSTPGDSIRGWLVGSAGNSGVLWNAPLFFHQSVRLVRDIQPASAVQSANPMAGIRRNHSVLLVREREAQSSHVNTNRFSDV